MDSGSDGEPELANAGQAYQLLLDTLPVGRKGLPAAGRPSKRRRTADSGEGKVKAAPLQAATNTAKSNGSASTAKEVVKAQQERGGAAKKSKRELAAEKRRVEDEMDSVEPAQAMARHLERLLSEPEAAELRQRRLEKQEGGKLQEAWPAGTWSVSGEPVQVAGELEAHGVRPRLVARWQEVHPALPQSGFTDPQQCAFFSLARSYKDVLFPAHPYPSSAGEEDPLVDAALLHCLDHVASTAQRIKKGNDALKADPSLEPPRDQGFTRPKVLLLLPMRNVAFRWVSRLLALAQKETRTDSVQGKARFVEDFGSPDEAAEPEGRRGRPAEHTALFAGNSDDHFRLGIKLTRGQVKLYSDFFQSDIIVASPIALATKLAEKDSPEDVDFLSSVEVVVAGRCDVCQMQNWSHMVAVFEALNGLPKDLHGADVMRVREWYLSGRATDYRQNILLTSFASPELNALFANVCHSHSGKARLQLAYEGVLGSSDGQVHQVFEKFQAKSHAEEIERRFDHFKARLWPRIRDSASGGQMIFVPSYLDYVRLRSFLRAEGMEFEGLSEYADGAEVARGRSRFAKGETRLAVYTERAHFYHRRFTRGVKDLYMYQLPEHAHYYTELLNLVSSVEGVEAGHTTVTALFSKFDALRLERIVGTSRAPKMLKATARTFLFS